jgi:hypothetical protein
LAPMRPKPRVAVEKTTMLRIENNGKSRFANKQFQLQIIERVRATIK